MGMTHIDDGFDHRFTPPSSETTWINVSGIPRVMGIVAFCFDPHDTAFIFYNTLRNPTTLRWSETVLLAVSVAMLISLVLSIFAYMTFGDAVQGNILNNYGIAEASMMATRVVYIIIMALTFPTAFFVVRHVVYAATMRCVSLLRVAMFRRSRSGRKQTMLMQHRGPIDVESSPQMLTDESSLGSSQSSVDQEVTAYAQRLFDAEYNVKTAPLWQHLLCTAFVFAVPLVCSLFILDLGVAMSVIGSLSSLNLVLVLPTLFYVKANWKRFGLLSFLAERSLSAKWTAWREVYPPLMLAVLGAVMAVHGVISTLTTPTTSG